MTFPKALLFSNHTALGRRFWGGGTRTIQTVSSLPNLTPKEIPANPNRVALTVVNTSSTTLFLSPDAKYAGVSGIRLLPDGGSVSLVFDEDGHTTSDRWYIWAFPAPGDFLTIETELTEDISNEDK